MHDQPNLTRRPFMLGAAAASLATLAATSTPALAQGRPSGLAVPVTGTTSAGRVVTGTFTPIAAVVQGATLLLQGVLSIAGAGSQVVQLPVDLAASSGSCTVLDLRTGQITLNLLGLELTLSPIRLLIEGNPAGGLLGQLLCAIAGLLGGGALTELANLLNRLLAIFR